MLQGVCDKVVGTPFPSRYLAGPSHGNFEFELCFEYRILLTAVAART